MDTRVLEELFSAYAAVMVASVVISIALFVFSLVCKWRIFSKAGEGGWKILIPIYNTYILFKIANAKARFWVRVVLTLAMSALSATFVGSIINYIQVVGYFPEITAQIALRILITFVIWLVIFIINVTVNFSLAKAFGLPAIFGLGLWLLPIIFYAIIAFSDSIQYASRRRYNRYLED